MAYRLPDLISLVCAAALAAVVGGCFDSDDKFRPNAGTTEAETTTTTTTTTSTTTTTEPETTGGQSILTCEDAIECLQDQCLLELITNPQPEPDLSCVLDCIEQEGLSVREAKAVLDLANCSGEACVDDGFCEGGEDTDGTGGGSTGGGSTGGGSTGGMMPPGPIGPIDPCLFCLFDRMTNPGKEPLACQPEHAACM